MDWLASLLTRQQIPELMDEPGLDSTAHRQALTDLARINRLSFSDAILWPTIHRLARQTHEPLRVLDIATGGGDVPVRLARRASHAGVAISWHGCDISETALQHARRNAEQAGATVEFFAHDILKEPLRDRYDVVMCSLFLHHLTNPDALEVLGRMRLAAGRRVLVNDLHRCALGYALAWLGVRVLSQSPIVRFDGPVSVRAAFSPCEARALAEAAGLVNVQVARKWPFRYLLSGAPQ